MKVIILDEDAYHEGLESYEIDFLVYNYICEGYEGYGEALLYKEGKWHTHYMGHCSCYGPFEELELNDPFDNLEDAMKDLYEDDWSNSSNVMIKKMHVEAINYIKETEAGGQDG